MGRTKMKNLAEPLTAESTQTIRALTRAELDGANQPRWYVVQLVVSDQPINLEMMPRLDVFAEHRLYTVVGNQSGRHRQALRLGFFAEERYAQMMCQHLQTYFPAPSVVRVSAAEQERFADKPDLRHQSQARTKSTPQGLNSASAQDRPIARLVAAGTPLKPTGMNRSAVAQPVAAGNGGTFLSPEMALKTGVFQAMAPQPRSAGTSPMRASKSSSSAPARAGMKKSKSLAEELMEEARQVQLSKSGKHPVAKVPQSWLSRLFGHPKR
jgi:hypothetical protein